MCESTKGLDVSEETIANRSPLLPDRYPQGDFFVCDIFDAVPKADMASMEHPIFSLSTKPDTRVREYEHNGIKIAIKPSVDGLATVHDRDVLIYCISQLMTALNDGKEVSQTVRFRAYDMLVATNRNTAGSGYSQLKAALERLAGTRISTNIVTGGREVFRTFGLIESAEVVRETRDGRMQEVEIKLSDWVFNAIRSKEVLTLHRDYFRLRKPLERRIYELARKHCGRQPEWAVSVTILHKKSGSAAPLRVFRAALRKMVGPDHLPDYDMIEVPGDLMLFTRRSRVVEAGQAPLLSVEALESARAILPGADIYALHAQWQGYWDRSGQAVLRNPDQAFLGWLMSRYP